MMFLERAGMMFVERAGMMFVERAGMMFVERAGMMFLWKSTTDWKRTYLMSSQNLFGHRLNVYTRFEDVHMCGFDSAVRGPDR